MKLSWPQNNSKFAGIDFICLRQIFTLNSNLYRLNKECTVRRHPFAFEKSSDWMMELISGRSSSQFSWKSTRPIMAIASESCRWIFSGVLSINFYQLFENCWVELYLTKIISSKSCSLTMWVLTCCLSCGDIFSSNSQHLLTTFLKVMAAAVRIVKSTLPRSIHVNKSRQYPASDSHC